MAKHSSKLRGKTYLPLALVLVALESMAADAPVIPPAQGNQNLPAALAGDPANSKIARVSSGATIPDSRDVSLPTQPGGLQMPPLPMAQPSREQIRDESFQALVESEMPMTPDMVRKLRKMLDELQKAKSELPNDPPKPVVSTIAVKGEPGESPPVIRLGRNFVTTLIFTDVTGAPWPIIHYGGGNDAIFKVENPNPETSHHLAVNPIGSYIFGGMEVTLEGGKTISLVVTSDQKSVDVNTTIQMLGRGPKAVAPTIYSGNTPKANPVMTSFVDGVAPEKAIALDSSDTRVQAWKLGDKYYIRTRMTMYAPSWTDHRGSPQGVHAYEITPIPVITAGEDGHPQQIVIGEK
ncbi:DotH/IcmK family type IV secretion protein [Methylobacillus sp. Pita2]|uniref:DotH/IcmK family type IV secretion protein n=1 Tax=Methylobacillus sp. Pita2 TaxID=3383245 RepID=UPI0038B4727C